VTSAVEAASLSNWTPIGFKPGPEGTLVEWINLGDADFVEPFFFETINKHLAQPGKTAESEILTTGPEVLCQLPQRATCLEPSGFIFHASRCGSTLLANALKAPADHLVLSEPRPLNQLLSSPLRHQAPEIWRQLFMATVAALGQPRRPGQQHYFVKYSSHAIQQFPAIRGAFPQVPWLFLYRHPLEILVSALSKPTGWLRLYDQPAVAQPFLGFSPEEFAKLTRESFAAEVLRRFFVNARQALDQSKGKSLCLSYEQLRPETLPAILSALGHQIDGESLRLASNLFAHHSKDGGKATYQEDSAEKQAAAGPALRALFHDRLEEPYQALELLRLSL
jgi:hypothetical protein